MEITDECLSVFLHAIIGGNPFVRVEHEGVMRIAVNISDWYDAVNYRRMFRARTYPVTLVVCVRLGLLMRACKQAASFDRQVVCAILNQLPAGAGCYNGIG